MAILLSLTTPEGVSLGQPATIAEVTASRYIHDVGALHCRLGIDWLPYLDYETRIEAWRVFPPETPILLRTYFIENITVVTDETKRSELSLDAYDANYLLKVRDIEAASGSDEAAKTDHADDLMKAYVREQAGSLSSYPLDADHFSVDADSHSGPSITTANAWSNLLQSLQEVSELSAGEGNKVYFDVVETGAPAQYRFRTATGQPGADHSAGSASRLLVGLDYGNVRSVTVVRDAFEEANHVISAGQGTKEERLTATAIGSGASRNIWSRKKLVYNDSAVETAAALAYQASRRLSEGRPRERIEFELMEAPGFRYGANFGLGDRLTISHQGRDYESVVKGLVFWVYENGAERLQSVAEVEL